MNSGAVGVVSLFPDLDAVEGLRSRGQVQQVVRDLFAPLIPCFSPGRARVTVSPHGACSSMAEAGLEGFARPLWGIVPLVMGGGEFAHWELFREGLTHGTDPGHPEFWGWDEGNGKQMHVEMAPIGFALATLPELLWEPLSPTAKKNVAAWLGQIYTAGICDNNWQFFRILTHLGLKRVGAAGEAGPVEDSFKKLASYYVEGGWYRDGEGRANDYYNPFAIHFYGLLYARLAGAEDPKRAARFREESTLFAKDFVSWFAEDGAALPFGRSLTYRFAQGSFWGALALADVEALPWGVIKGLAMRHLRWWLRRPIFNASGQLTVGYAYPNLIMAEPYNCGGSPYWAMKFFQMLAVAESHPFWQAEEEPLPELPRVSVQKPAGLVLCREEGEVVALATAQSTSWMRGATWMRHVPAKYCKFAYSTRFGFSVPAGDVGLAFGAYDSMLALSEEGEYWRARTENVESRIEGNVIYARWRPWVDVEIETWLIPVSPWHVRVHRLKTGRALVSAEGGFATSEMDEVLAAGRRFETGEGFAKNFAPPNASGICDLAGTRAGEITLTLPNTNLLFAKAAVPMLRGTHAPGEHHLFCAVLESGAGTFEGSWGKPPKLEREGKGLVIRSGETGEVVFAAPGK